MTNLDWDGEQHQGDQLEIGFQVKIILLGKPPEEKTFSYHFIKMLLPPFFTFFSFSPPCSICQKVHFSGTPPDLVYADFDGSDHSICGTCEYYKASELFIPFTLSILHFTSIISTFNFDSAVTLSPSPSWANQAAHNDNDDPKRATIHGLHHGLPPTHRCTKTHGPPGEIPVSPSSGKVSALLRSRALWTPSRRSQGEVER